MFVHLFGDNKPVELCIDGNRIADSGDSSNNNSPINSNSLESSMSTYDSMMQTLNDELNHDNVNRNNPDRINLMDFEDMDFFKMDCATAMSFDYEMNYTMKQLKHIAGYYGIKNKTRKVDIVQDIVVYETDVSNSDAVAHRKRLFHYMDALKNDEYFKSFIMM
jgi:hypothetical protein